MKHIAGLTSWTIEEVKDGVISKRIFESTESTMLVDEFDDELNVTMKQEVEVVKEEVDVTTEDEFDVTTKDELDEATEEDIPKLLLVDLKIVKYIFRKDRIMFNPFGRNKIRRGWKICTLGKGRLTFFTCCVFNHFLPNKMIGSEVVPWIVRNIT